MQAGDTGLEAQQVRQWQPVIFTESVPFDPLSQQQRVNDECFGLATLRADGAGCDHLDRSLAPIPFLEPVFSGEKVQRRSVYKIHISPSPAILRSSLPAGNAIRFVARGQLDPLP